jgi:glycosyltransferase involved in cell wall biosynthesis
VVAAHFARRLRIPFVVSEHAPWWSIWFDRPGVAAAAVPAANQAAAILAVSPSVADTIRDHAGYGPRIEVVPVGVDGDFFKPGLNGGRKPDQILFAGILKYVKGVDVLLRAVARLAAQGVPARLLVAGGSLYPNTLWEEREIRELATTLDLGDRVAFLGRLRPEEIARLMAESSVVVLPSQLESFGAVLVEALACGTPVVATRCGGPESIVTDAVGELVPIGDADALAEALGRVLSRPERFDRALLRSYALSKFGLDSVVLRTVELYRDAIT